MTLQELNREYYEIYGDLYNARSLLPPKQYKAITEALQKAYADDLERVLLTKELSVGRKRFELRFKAHNWLPRRKCLFWWNPVAKLLNKRFIALLTAELERLEKTVQKVESAHEPVSVEKEPINQESETEPSSTTKEAKNAESVVETIKDE